MFTLDLTYQKPKASQLIIHAQGKRTSIISGNCKEMQQQQRSHREAERDGLSCVKEVHRELSNQTRIDTIAQWSSMFYFFYFSIHSVPSHSISYQSVVSLRWFTVSSGKRWVNGAARNATIDANDKVITKEDFPLPPTINSSFTRLTIDKHGELRQLPGYRKSSRPPFNLNSDSLIALKELQRMEAI